MDVGSSFDCGAGQTGSSPVTEIEVPGGTAGDPVLYDVWTTLSFGDASELEFPDPEGN